MNRFTAVAFALCLCSCSDQGTPPDSPDWRIDFTGSYTGAQVFDFDQNGNATFEVVLKSQMTSMLVTITGSIHDSIGQRRPIIRRIDTVGIFGGPLSNPSGIYTIFSDGGGYWFTYKNEIE